LNVFNVVNNYVGRNFMTAIAERQAAEFVRQAIFYICVFVALTFVGVITRFAEERLALLWREFLTRRAVNLYLENGTYYRLDVSGRLAHPDQQIAEDIKAFTMTTLSYVIMLFGSSLTVVSSPAYCGPSAPFCSVSLCSMRLAKIEFGVITQAGAAFAMFVGAFSLIIRQFNSISNFAAVVSRLSSLLESIEQTRAVGGSNLELVEEPGRLSY